MTTRKQTGRRRITESIGVTRLPEMKEEFEKEVEKFTSAIVDTDENSI